MVKQSDETFWRLIRDLNEEVQSSGNTISQALSIIFDTATTMQLKSISEVYPKLRRHLQIEQVYGAFVVIFDGFSEDVFHDFCNGVISLGLEAYTFAINSPDRLAEIDVHEGMTWFPEDFEPTLVQKCEEAGLQIAYYLPELAYPFLHLEHGENPDDANDNYEEKLRVYEEDLKIRLPRLWNRYRVKRSTRRLG